MKKSSLVKLLCFFILLCFCNKSFAQKEYTVFNYNTKNGLIQNSIGSLAIDSLGFLWMATENGLIQFDGRTFKTFNTSNTPAFASNYLREVNTTLLGQLVATDLNGGLYLISKSKIFPLKKGNLDLLNYLNIKGRLPSIEFYIKNTTPDFRSVLAKDLISNPLSVFPQSTKDYGIQTKTGIAFYKNDIRKQEINLEQYQPKAIFGINNNIYFLSSSHLVYLINLSNYTIIPCTLGGNLLPENISALSLFFNSSDLTTTIVSSKSAYVLSAANSPSQIDVHLLTNQLPDDCAIQSIAYSAKNKMIAVGTDSKGLFILKENNFKTQTFNATNGFNNAYYSLLALDSNTVLTDRNRQFDTYGSSICKLNINRNIAENIFRDHQNNFWYCNQDSLIKFNPSTNKHKVIAYLKGDRVLSFQQSGDSILISTVSNIGCIKNDSIHIIYHFNNQATNSNLYRVFIEQNKLWFCNYKGVYNLNLATQQIDTLKVLYQKYVHNMMQHKGYILIGTYGSGYYLYKNGRLVEMPLDANNYLLNVHVFLNDTNGITWMSTNHGVFRIPFKNLENYFNDTTSAVNYMYYNEDNGMKTSEFNGGCSPSGLILKNGDACLPSMDGIVRFTPTSFIDPYFKSPVIIETFFWNDKPDTSSTKIIPAGIKNIRIDFATAYWGNAKNLILEYKLTGFSNDWKKIAEGQNSIEFSGLHSGHYTLLIRKVCGFDTDEYITTSIDFKIEKRFFETAWFFLLCIFSSILFVITVARLYAFKIKKSNKILEEKINLRTSELQNANKELQQSITLKDKLISIISHDIVTPLRFISMVARKAGSSNDDLEKENMRTALSEIKNTSEKLRDNAQNILNWIKFQNKRINLNITNVAIGALVDDIAEMQKEMADSVHTTVVNNVSYDDIIKTDKSILSIILNNIITNAIKFTANGSITIESKTVDLNYFITITDTGIGMNEQQLKRIETTIIDKSVNTNSHASDGNGNGLGYVIISELSALLNGKISVESQPGEGTIVTLSISLMMN